MHYMDLACEEWNEERLREVVLEADIAELMSQIGFSAHLRGYRYIKTAVKRCLVDPGELEGITKHLYPEVAREHDTTAGKVEHGIRHAIESAWKKDNHREWESLFGYSLPQEGRKPTNGELIATMADYLTINNNMLFVK